MDERYLSQIRKFEGFTPQAVWDYKQNSNGYGTRAKFPGEVIDRDEAERRLQSEIANARAIVDRVAPGVDEGTKAALTSLTYNAGDKWASSGLGDAIRRGDMETARSLFTQYNKAGGEVLPGLQSRRNAEAAWMGGSTPDATAQAAAPQGENMDFLAALSQFVKAGGPPAAPATGGGIPLPGGMKLQGDSDLLKQTMATLQPQQMSAQPAQAMERQPIDMSRLASILSNRSRLGV